MTRKIGITKATQRRAERAVKGALKTVNNSGKFKDSFQNFALNLGMGTDNAISGSTYGFNPITRNRTLLEWIHRGSWLGKMAVNVVADDMVRAGIDIQCDAEPDQVDGVQEDLTTLGVWDGLRDSAAWARLYGGAIGVIMIDGQDYAQPLNPDRIGKGMFRGVVALDRWTVEPSLGDLCSEPGPDLGMPNYYRVTSDYPGLRMKIVHRSRVIRFLGDKLPYWQQVSENLWGASVIESLYDRMVAFDSATQGAAQLAYKSYLRTVKIKGLRELIAASGPALAAFYEFMDVMRRYQGIEGVTLLDCEDDFVAHSGGNFAGLSDVMLQMGQQLSGALQIPLTRMFGQSPAGLNSTGESDLRTYYDGINQRQVTTMSIGIKKIVMAAALSGGWKIGDDFKVTFRPLWQLSEEQKSEVSSKDTTSVVSAEAGGLVSQKTALKELRTQSKTTGRWTNITDEDIESASDELAPRGQDAIDQEREGLEHRADVLGGGDDKSGKDAKEPKEPKSFKDARLPSSPFQDASYYQRMAASYAQLAQRATRAGTADSLPVSEICGIPIAIETVHGSVRRGVAEDGTPWETVMPADYGYIRRAPSAEGPTEWLDCFVGPIRSGEGAGSVYVIDSYEPLGKFDEHKVMLGFPDEKSALRCFHDAYNDGRRAGTVTPMSTGELIRWYSTGDVTRPIGKRNLRLAASGAA